MMGYIGRFKLKYFLAILFFSIIFIYFLKINENQNDYPVLLWWTPFMWEDAKVINCDKTCILTKNRSYKNHPNLVACLFYGSDFDPSDLPLPKDKIWAIIHEESPKNLALFLHNETHKLFNLTSTFSRNSHFPIPLQYLDNINSIIDTKYYVDLKVKNELLKELAPVLYIQSDCDTPIERDNYVRELMKFIRVDSYGTCLKNKDFPKDLSTIGTLDLYHKDFLHFVAKYKFTIAFENAICNDYITEKLWRPLIVGSVPIYKGSPTIEDWLPNNNSAILVKNFKTPKELAIYLDKINNNDELYLNYLDHKLNGEIKNLFLKEQSSNLHFGDNNPITAFECFVCNIINNKNIEIKPLKRPIYNCPIPNPYNRWSSHWKMGKCQAKALVKLVERGKNYTKDYFDSTWKSYLSYDECDL